MGEVVDGGSLLPSPGRPVNQETSHDTPRKESHPSQALYWEPGQVTSPISGSVASLLEPSP